MKQTHHQALPQDYMLEEYRIQRVLGAGGFGITYLGLDTSLNKTVAIKEYLPENYAVRKRDNSVQPKSRADKKPFAWGKKRVLDEAQALARFKHPNIVIVHRFFEANNTAYIVMEHVEGKPLSTMLRQSRLRESRLLSILLPLLDGLEKIHQADVLHRDIKPDNIVIRADGSPVLLDFGAAREIGNLDSTRILTPGFAPLEQYSTDGDQGPWTDIYALGAVAYMAVCGTPPPDAVDRVRRDRMNPAVEEGQGQYSVKVLQAIDWALSMEERERPQNAEILKNVLQGERDIGSESSNQEDEIKAQQKLAESGDADGQLELGRLYLEKKDYTQAAHWFRKAAEQGHALAQNNLGTCYAEGWGVPIDATEALSWRHKAAEQGFAAAQFYVGSMYASGEGVPQDSDRAMLWWHEAAKQGYSDAMHSIGLSYMAGSHTYQDIAEAVCWWRKAAQQGHGMAHIYLGQAYRAGAGVEKDHVESMRWYRMAAKQGLPEAHWVLGNAYQNGIGVPQNYTKAYRWLYSAAMLGDAPAQNDVGLLYREGKGVPQDDKRAAKWWLKAAKNGNVDGQHNIGMCYYHGKGVPQDRVEAVHWLRKAARQDVALDQARLGNIYQHGLGIPHDLIEAYMWYNITLTRDNSRKLDEREAHTTKTALRIAQKGIQELEQTMTPNQIAEAQDRVREWHRKYRAD